MFNRWDVSVKFPPIFTLPVEVIPSFCDPAVSNRKKHWCATGVGVEYVVLKLQETGLITSLEVDNKDCDGLEVYLSEVNRKTAFKLCKKIKFAAKGRKFVVRVGHVPCQYIKVCFLKNNLRPGPIIFLIFANFAAIAGLLTLSNI